MPDFRSKLTDLDQPLVRFFMVPRRGTGKPQDDTSGEWLSASGEVIGLVSGAALACALRLQRRLGVPVGIIQASVGGTGAEWWTRREVLDAHPDLRPMMDQLRQSGGDADSDTPEAQAALAAWTAIARHQDPGIAAMAQSWSMADFADAAWATMPLPCTWESQGHLLDGACWFRRTITLPVEWVGRDLLLNLGTVDDFDHTFVNGELIGPHRSGMPRRLLPAAPLHRARSSQPQPPTFDRGARLRSFR